MDALAATKRDVRRGRLGIGRADERGIPSKNLIYTMSGFR